MVLSERGRLFVSSTWFLKLNMMIKRFEENSFRKFGRPNRKNANQTLRKVIETCFLLPSTITTNQMAPFTLYSFFFFKNL